MLLMSERVWISMVVIGKCFGLRCVAARTPENGPEGSMAIGWAKEWLATSNSL
jgi:hypothetical protein